MLVKIIIYYFALIFMFKNVLLRDKFIDFRFMSRKTMNVEYSKPKGTLDWTMRILGPIY